MGKQVLEQNTVTRVVLKVTATRLEIKTPIEIFYCTVWENYGSKLFQHSHDIFM